MLKHEELLPVSELRKIVRIDPETGLIFWLLRDASQFHASAKRSAEHIKNNWNSRYAGTQAFSCLTKKGYLCGTLNSKLNFSHRIAYALYKGEWPENFVDHINGVKTDNREENLRNVSRHENAKNKQISSNNTSGENGISWDKGVGKWFSKITIEKNQIYLGVFDSLEEAVKSRKEAEKKYGFHKNHGRGRATEVGKVIP